MWQKAHQQLKIISKQYAVRHMRKSMDTLNSLPKDLRKKVDDVLTRFVAVIPPNASVEKKVALIYYVLTSQISYDYKGMDNERMPYTFISALCKKKAVCMGIAELFTYLCALVGVKAVTVIGYACNTSHPSDTEDDGGLHAWVMVRLSDQRWYHLDATWDIHKASDKNWRPRWFLLSDQEMDRHYWIREDYPKAKTRFREKIELNTKGVDLLCKHWQNLTKEFE